MNELNLKKILKKRGEIQKEWIIQSIVNMRVN